MTTDRRCSTPVASASGRRHAEPARPADCAPVHRVRARSRRPPPALRPVAPICRSRHLATGASISRAHASAGRRLRGRRLIAEVSDTCTHGACASVASADAEVDVSRSSRATARRRRSRWCSMARVASTVDLVGGRRGRLGQRAPPARRRGCGAAARAASAPIGAPRRHVRHSTPPSPTSKATSGSGGAARHARVELGPQALGGQHLPVERRHQQRRRAGRPASAARRPASGTGGGWARAPGRPGRPPRAGPWPG